MNKGHSLLVAHRLFRANASTIVALTGEAAGVKRGIHIANLNQRNAYLKSIGKCAGHVVTRGARLINLTVVAFSFLSYINVGGRAVNRKTRSSCVDPSGC